MERGGAVQNMSLTVKGDMFMEVTGAAGLIFMLRRIETASLLCQMRVLLVMDFACLCIQSLFLFFFKIFHHFTANFTVFDLRTI